jgi:glucose-6-phosphate 1-dehydrogenase
MAPTTLVLFGATGDLCRRKLLPALHHLSLHGLLVGDTRIFATAPDGLSPEQFASLGRAAVSEHSAWSGGDRLLQSVRYVPAEAGRDGLAALAAAVRSAPGRPIFYLAVPPCASAGITERLVASGLAADARIVYEKSFGEDRRAFGELTALVRTLLDEEQVLCVDHYLAKESVRQIMRARFAGRLFDRVWSRGPARSNGAILYVLR